VVQPLSRKAQILQTFLNYLATVSKTDTPRSVFGSGRTIVGLVSQQLADSMLPLVVREREPTVPQVTDFASEFARALVGRTLSNEQVVALQQCIVDMLRGQGISNFALAKRLQETSIPASGQYPRTRSVYEHPVHTANIRVAMSAHSAEGPGPPIFAFSHARQASSNSTPLNCALFSSVPRDVHLLA
jgi:hypothetical protein